MLLMSPNQWIGMDDEIFNINNNQTIISLTCQLYEFRFTLIMCPLRYNICGIGLQLKR